LSMVMIKTNEPVQHRQACKSSLLILHLWPGAASSKPRRLGRGSPPCPITSMAWSCPRWLGLPAKCDGCRQNFFISHALICKQGGLVTLCHDDVGAKWHHLCVQALMPVAVSNKPLIHTMVGMAQQEREPMVQGSSQRSKAMLPSTDSGTEA
jgi:hypothetical protein